MCSQKIKENPKGYRAAPDSPAQASGSSEKNSYSHFRKYICTLRVRGYELDSYAHLNHAVYVQYLEQARWEMLESENIQLTDFTRWKRWPVVSEIEAKYRRPCFMGDLLRIETQAVEKTRTSFVFEQIIRREEDIILQARVRVVFTNELGKPSPIPPELDRIGHPCEK